MRLKGCYRGTHRLVPLEETVARALSFAKQIGITRVANVTGLDCIGIPVIIACRPNSRSLAVSQGKGLDLISAKASALMESIEFYHAERITLALKFASLEEIQNNCRVIDLPSLPSRGSAALRSDQAILWIEGIDLVHDRSTWLPYELVHTNYTLAGRVAAGVFSSTSNGLASGNHVLEAISHGICEVVERDSTTLWYLKSSEEQNATRIDLSTVNDPDCQELLDKYRQARISVAVWETTTDVGIPSFLCTIIEDRETFRPLLYPASGMGCHPTREIALIRALTEAAQSRLTAVAGTRDDLLRPDYERLLCLETLDTIRKQMEQESGARSFGNVRSWTADSFEQDVEWELGRLCSCGFTSVVMIELTKPEISIPVVRIVIPGMEGISTVPDYTPGSRARRILASRT